MLDIQFVNTPFGTVTKAYRGDNGEMYVEGVASSTDMDRTHEKMSPEAIKLMAAKFTGKPLNSEHHADWDDELGKIVKSEVIDANTANPKLWIKAKLNDWLTRSKDLFNGLNDGKLMGIGLSVEGKINPGGLVKELDPISGKVIPVYKDIDPAAVAITNKPANLATFCNAVTKSINVDDLPEAKSNSYVVVRKVIEGQPDDATQKDFSPTDHVPLAVGDQQTLTCGHGMCPDGMCLGQGCVNMCDKCMATKDMGVGNAGPVPETLLARQDLAGKEKSDKTSTEKAAIPANTIDPNKPKAGEAEGAQNADNDDPNNPDDGKYCTHDYCMHGNCMEGACPNKCSQCSTAQEILGGENKIDGAPAANTAIVGKDITNAHQTKPSKYSDVPEDKFLDTKNHKYPVDQKHLPAALSYFNHQGQRSAGGYSTSQWSSMGSKLAGLLGGEYHYDSSSEKVVESNSDGDTKKSQTEGGDYDMQQTNKNLVQKAQYSQEILNLLSDWGAKNNPGNQDLFAKAGASAVSADEVAKNGQVQQQQTVQKGSSSSDKSSSSDGSSSDGSSSDSSTSSGSTSTSSGSTSTSSGESLSSLLSSVLTTLSDMKSSVSGDSSGSSSDSSSGSSSSDKTSTDKAASGGSDSSKGGFPFNSAKTSTDKAFPNSVASDATSDTADSTDEATKALSLALLEFLKTKKQPQTGQFPENGTQTAKKPGEGNDSVNGPAQVLDDAKAPHRKEPMPKADTGSTDNVNGKPQEPNYNALGENKESSSVGSMGKSLANKDQYVKSIDQLSVLMTKIAEKVEAVEGKVDSLPNTRKGYAMTKNFTQEEEQEIAKSQDAFKSMEAKIHNDPKTTWKDLHQFRTSEGKILPAGYVMPKE